MFSLISEERSISLITSNKEGYVFIWCQFVGWLVGWFVSRITQKPPKQISTILGWRIDISPE